MNYFAAHLFLPYFPLIKWALIGQYLFILVHIGVILTILPLIYFLKRKSERKFTSLKSALLLAIQKRIPLTDLSLPSRSRTSAILIPTIKKIDEETKEPFWNELKKAIYDTFLLPKAQKLAYAKRWSKRIEAISCFALFPDLKNEPYILHLLLDSTPVIQYSAASCAAKLGTSSCINAIIDEMNKVDRFLRHPFQDALLKAPTSALKYLEKRLEQDLDPFTRVSCLEVLAHRMNPEIADLAARDLHAKSKNLRIAAIRTLGYDASAKSISLLLPLLQDPEWEIRALTARSLGYQKADEALLPLSALLQDKVWWVRMNSALALKRLGEKGRKQLEKQSPEGDRYAYEIARYVLTFDTYE